MLEARQAAAADARGRFRARAGDGQQAESGDKVPAPGGNSSGWIRTTDLTIMSGAL
jgi:hypothetical protein